MFQFTEPSKGQISKHSTGTFSEYCVLITWAVDDGSVN